MYVIRFIFKYININIKKIQTLNVENKIFTNIQQKDLETAKIHK